MKWTPNDIKAELVRKGITQSDIARSRGVSVAQVNRVINYGVVSDHVRREIAQRLGVSVEEIWPEYYLARMAG